MTDAPITTTEAIAFARGMLYAAKVAKRTVTYCASTPGEFAVGAMCAMEILKATPEGDENALLSLYAAVRAGVTP